MLRRGPDSPGIRAVTSVNVRPGQTSGVAP